MLRVFYIYIDGRTWKLYRLLACAVDLGWGIGREEDEARRGEDGLEVREGGERVKRLDESRRAANKRD